MIAYVKGILEDISADNAVIDVGGVGINVRVSTSTASSLRLGEEVKLYTFTYVREDTFSLYGFIGKEDLELFKMLLGVSGVGPKGALGVLSVLSANDLRFAIASADSKMISKAPGIGKRTAERIVLDLRDKISALIPDEGFVPSGVAMDDAPAQIPGRNEAVEALVALGYSASEAAKAVSKVPEEEAGDTGTLLKAALKYIM